ncbi:MAG TPA: hypothetical protein VG518_07765 [Solirubrobacterales bacterium]|nr:hypothetical protein [Solirubrobacterales bacterium]
MDEKPKSRASTKAKSKAAPKKAAAKKATAPPEGAAPTPSPNAGHRQPRPPAKKIDARTFRIGLAALLAVVVVVVGAIAIFGGGSDSDKGSSGSSEAKTNAVALSEAELAAKVGEMGQPVFWIGPRAGTESYELSSTPDGSVYIRYLTGGAKAGEEKADFLTVGTYPVPEAAKALADAAEREGQDLAQRKGFQVLGSEQATSAYVVFDDQPDIQVEIFSPEPGEADQLAGSGALAQVE